MKPSPWRWSEMTPARQAEALRVAKGMGRDAYGARPWRECPFSEPNQAAAWREGYALARAAAKAMEESR